MAARKKKLTEERWEKVFYARCKSKQGQPVTEEESVLLDTAYASDLKRYTSLDEEVFNATVPFGSSARWGKKR